MTIHQWLQSGQDYQTGVTLYSQYGTSSVWKILFAQSETEYNQEKLVELLTEIAGNQKPEPTPTQTDSNGLIEKIKSKWLPLYKRMSHLHAQLVHVSQVERGEMAFEILELEQQINALWKQEKYVRIYGKQPDVAVIESTQHDLSTDIGIQKRILNLRVSISKHRNNPKRTQDVEKWEVEKQLLEDKLNQLEDEKNQV